MTDSPCHDCEFRDPPCWGECEIYKAWKKQVEAERHHTTHERCVLSDMWNYGGCKRKKK